MARLFALGSTLNERELASMLDCRYSCSIHWQDPSALATSPIPARSLSAILRPIMIQFTINILTAICSGFAAYHWYRASQVKEPPAALVGYAGFTSRGDGHTVKPNASVDANPLVEWARESSKRNKTAATRSVAAAVFAALGWVLALFIPHANAR